MRKDGRTPTLGLFCALAWGMQSVAKKSVCSEFLTSKMTLVPFPLTSQGARETLICGSALRFLSAPSVAGSVAGCNFHSLAIPSTLSSSTRLALLSFHPCNALSLPAPILLPLLHCCPTPELGNSNLRSTRLPKLVVRRSVPSSFQARHLSWRPPAAGRWLAGRSGQQLPSPHS